MDWKPTGTIHEDDIECDACERLLKMGEQYWGGDLDYWGEANSLKCKACAMNDIAAAKAMCDDYEAKLEKPTQKEQ